jgi:hypothetical protein
MKKKQVSVTVLETPDGSLQNGHFRSSSAAPRHLSNLRGSALDPRTIGHSLLALVFPLVRHSANSSCAPIGAQLEWLHA